MTRFSPGILTVLFALAMFSCGRISQAHPPVNTKLPPTKATPDLKKARELMDIAKTKLAMQGKYACCVKAPEGSKAAGCDLCARVNGSCNCAANSAAGKGVCGDCLSGWKAGKVRFPI